MNFKQFKKELFKDKEFKEYYDKEEKKEPEYIDIINKRLNSLTQDKLL